jgi:serine/threonine protein kinase
MAMPPGGLPGLKPVPAGTRFGPYELIRHVATGGTSSVYVARRTDESGFEKIVALKLIHPYLAQHDEFVEMFLAEARIAAKISHANVCPVFDFGRHGALFYLAMEYIAGEPLTKVSEALAANPESRTSKAFYPILATILADASEGLHAAHELRDYNGKLMNIVHRDVSPANIFVAYNGAVRVVDFGFAQSETKIHQTQPGMIMGTFAYMSPEQVDGKEVDRRADIWGVGVVLWELITGARLFDRKQLHTTFEAILQDDIPDVREYAPDAPEQLAAVVRQCVTRDLGKRHATARMLSQELRRFVAEAHAAVGPAEVSAWMQSLFPMGLAQQNALEAAPRQRPVAAPPTWLTTPIPVAAWVSIAVAAVAGAAVVWFATR